MSIKHCVELLLLRLIQGMKPYTPIIGAAAAENAIMRVMWMRKRINRQLVNNWKGYLNASPRPALQSGGCNAAAAASAVVVAGYVNWMSNGCSGCGWPGAWCGGVWR